MNQNPYPRILGLFATFSFLFFLGCQKIVHVPKSRDGDVNQSQPEFERRDGLQALCDVERYRIRTDLLSHYRVEELRQVALKISGAITREETEDLKRLQLARQSNRDLSSYGQLRAAEIVKDIYTGAIARAGLKIGTAEAPAGSDRAVTVDVFLHYSIDEEYVNLVRGDFVKPAQTVGAVSSVLLGGNAEQSRYLVTLLRHYRYENEADGRMTPVLEPLTLLEYADQALPSYCRQSSSAIIPPSFNTISGVSHGS